MTFIVSNDLATNNSFENADVNEFFGALYLSVEIYTKLICEKNSITEIFK